jgi:outer membrane protein insertion porin family
LNGKFTPPYSLLGSKKWQSTDSKEAYKFIEYMKFRFDAEWYTTLVGKLVFKASTKMGILSAYNKNVGLSPFERYELGGDGLSNQGSFFNGREIISSRGYEVAEFAGNGASGNAAGAAVFNKNTLELRYPISLNPSSTIYALGFAQASNAWSRAKDWTPFDLKRSAGVGLRVFLPMFGTLGFDYGVGFDKPEIYQTGNRKLTGYGKFNIILGFEPD